MLIRVGYEIAVEVTSPTAVYTYLNVHPQHHKDIVWACSEEIAGTRHIDIHGNEFVRQTLPAGETVLSHDVIVENSGLPDIFDENAAQVDPALLPTECLPYLLGSRYCETDRMSQIAWNRFGHYQGGAERVRAICDFVNAHLSFSYGYARSTRTALEAYNERVGVCRDFAHLTITLCRALNIPARYANGFMGDIGVPADPSPMDYNAWVEVFLDGQWFTVDARHNQPRIGRILVARGRDASDIPLFSTFGPHRLNRFEVWTEEYRGLQSNVGKHTRPARRISTRYGPAGRSPRDLGVSPFVNCMI
ncbi:hypothetical protein Brsp05_03941 [Brucella sp. NBRC 12953]|uniref:transglutaminase-like domain-containing protein n=1 Tax=Brucella sp. NBRC 12953 TaxID=3075481 RepID=UPI00309C64C0